MCLGAVFNFNTVQTRRRGKRGNKCKKKIRQGIKTKNKKGTKVDNVAVGFLVLPWVLLYLLFGLAGACALVVGDGCRGLLLYHAHKALLRLGMEGYGAFGQLLDAHRMVPLGRQHVLHRRGRKNLFQFVLVFDNALIEIGLYCEIARQRPKYIWNTMCLGKVNGFKE